MTRETRSAKEERFCIEVVRPGNSLSGAYRIAFQPKNCSAKTIHEKASRLHRTGKVRARIAELLAPVIASAQDDRVRWLKEIERLAFYDPRKLFDAQGNLLKINQLDADTAPGIAGYECFKRYKGKGKSRVVSYTKSYKLTDRFRALELLAKAFGLFPEKASIPPSPASHLDQATTEMLLKLQNEAEGRTSKG
jgi:phage terminase small subunit